MKKHFSLPAKLLLGGLLLTACVDDSYDLDNIDLTIGTSANLALPLINTSEIKIAHFLLSKVSDGKDFLDAVTIPGVVGKVIYAHTQGNFSTLIPTVLDGVVDFEATTPDIAIPELPDFMKDEGVRLDLKNPIFIANVKSNLPEGCDIKLDIEISTPEASCKVNGLKASSKKKLCQYIAAERDDNIPAELLDGDYGTPVQLKPVAGSSVNDLFKNKIPENLQVKVIKMTAENVGSAPIAGPFDIFVDLTLYAPLCVGSQDFCLSYVATETGWANEFDADVRKINLDALELRANLTNNLPLSVDVTIEPIDPDGIAIPDLSVLKANAESGKTSTVEYIMKANKSGLTLRDYLNGSNGAQQLDGVRIVSKLKANAQSVGKYITDEASARFTSMELRAKGTVTYDAN
ncbi:MAG: hypothetical protein IK144_09735 [Bacteroidaceae bacterium]|nr:hypothetical protein [Bacteroidaceae bacterium]